MKRDLLIHGVIYGLVGGVLIALLKWTEYRFLVVEHSIEIYGGLVAAVFSGLGIWLGIRLTGGRGRGAQNSSVKALPVAANGAIDTVNSMTAERLVGAERLVSSEKSGAAGGLAVVDVKRREELGITPRELEVLELIALGMSNREIANKLFVSENTVKTHSSRVFDKLGARRRTQAVQLGKEMGLL